MGQVLPVVHDCFRNRGLSRSYFPFGLLHPVLLSQIGDGKVLRKVFVLRTGP